ncbi:MAG TPA: MBL fold metallo-hydrolase [Gaiellaceae bacterium]|nr:MBL fold metallo-hydrolase [Gaiellaceae bacterium]
MRLTVVGCSPAWPNAGGAHAGYLVEGERGRVLLDCGPGVLSRLRAREGWPRLDAIVVSHFHPDHSGDLPPWLWGHRTGPARGLPAPALWLPPGGHRELGRFSDRFDETFPVHEYEPGVAFAAGGLIVTPYAVSHYDIPTFGLRVEEHGSVLAYSADTGPTPALAALARDADLFLCEATLEERETGLRGHLTSAEAAEASASAGARRLLLVHRPEELPANGFEVAHEGLEVQL